MRIGFRVRTARVAAAKRQLRADGVGPTASPTRANASTPFDMGYVLRADGLTTAPPAPGKLEETSPRAKPAGAVAQAIHEKLAQIEALARAMSKDSSLKIVPGDFWAYWFDANTVTVPVHQLLTRAPEEVLALVEHELGHRLFSRNLIPADDLELAGDKLQRKALMNIWNAIEDPRVNDIQMARHAGVPALMNALYLYEFHADSLKARTEKFIAVRREIEAKRRGIPESELPADAVRLGTLSLIQQFGQGVIHRWARERFGWGDQATPGVTDPRVLQALDELDDVLRAAMSVPKELHHRELTNDEIDAEALRSWQLVRHQIWPRIKPFLDEDIRTRKEKIEEAKPQASQSSNEPKGAEKSNAPQEGAESSPQAGDGPPGEGSPGEGSPGEGSPGKGTSGEKGKAGSSAAERSAREMLERELDADDDHIGHSEDPPADGASSAAGAKQNAGEANQAGSDEKPGDETKDAKGPSGDEKQGDGKADGASTPSDDSGGSGGESSQAQGASNTPPPEATDATRSKVAKSLERHIAEREQATAAAGAAASDAPKQPTTSDDESGSTPGSAASDSADGEAAEAAGNKDSATGIPKPSTGEATEKGDAGASDTPASTPTQEPLASLDDVFDPAQLDEELKRARANLAKAKQERNTNVKGAYALARKHYGVAISELRAVFNTLFQKSKQMVRDPVPRDEGDEFNLEYAMSSRFEAKATGRKPDPRVWDVYRVPTMPDAAHILVGDCSFSMGGERIAALQATAVAWLEAFASTTHAHGVVKFSSTATPVKPLEGRVSLEERERIVAELVQDGSTHMEAGLAAAIELCSRSRARDKYMYVITDGDPTAPSSKEGVRRLVHAARAMGIHIIGIGIGEGMGAVKECFGQNVDGSEFHEGYVLVPDVAQLPRALGKVLEKQERKRGRRR